MPRRPSAAAVAAAVAVALGAALGGCADAVDPTLGTDQAFSLYGHLDPTTDRQTVRVVPIVRVLEADTARALAVTVTSTEAETGRTATWRDSLVTYVDGTPGHLFLADYAPTPGTTVVIEVTETGGDRRTTTVRVPVPAIAPVEVAPAEVDEGVVTYPLSVAAPRVILTDLVYRVSGLPPTPADTVEVAHPAAPALLDAGGGTWALDLDFLATSREFLASPAAAGARLRLVDVRFRAFVANEAWAVPVGGFDLDRIVEPGTFTNVEGGFGFVGAGYWASVRWTPSLTTKSRAGFVVDTDPASALFVNEVDPGEGWVEFYNPTLEAIPLGRYRVADAVHETAVPDGVVVGPEAFYVVRTNDPFEGDALRLLSLSDARVLEYDLGRVGFTAFNTWGAYPDGRTQTVVAPGGGRTGDLFQGPLRATPGAPNEPNRRPGIVNEIVGAAEGGREGLIEVYRTFGARDLFVASGPDVVPGQWVPVTDLAGLLGGAREAPGAIELSPGGGEVYVIVNYFDEPPRVVDARRYGPQVSGRSSGLVPDSDLTGWVEATLLPTPGRANRAARFASR